MDCPTDEELRRQAASCGLTGPVAEHICACSACRQRMEDLSGDAEALRALRSAWQDRLDDAVRQRIDEICREATSRRAADG